MLKVKTLSLTVALWAAITYTLCVIYGLLVPPQFHAAELLETVLPGFHWITFGSFLIGLAESFVYGAYTGLVFGLVYNTVQRRTAAA